MADLKAPGKVRPHGESFTIEICDKNQREKTNLQDSFLKFKKAKQREIRTTKKMKKKRRKKQRNPEQMQKLREKFIEKAKKYYGVPYARKYWPPESEEYQSKLFLDCCGLVRQVVRDLSKDFGFHIGPWNQAYMYDTLPITIEHEQDMKPGDLVFMSGIYPNPKARQQKHNMTHVEIWAGEGKKTIGARWNSGKVQMWDSYQFEAKSFHSAQYYFKSIDTWLLGVCKSFCPEHKWKRRKFRPEKKSIFKDTVSANDVDKTQTMKTKDQKNEENQVEKIEDIAADETEDVDKQDDDIDSSSSVSEEGEDNFCSDSDDDDDINASPDDTENEQIESSSVMESRFSLVGSYPKYYQRQQIMHGCSSSAINKPRKTQSAIGENEKSRPDICILKKDSFYQSKAKPETLSHEQLDLAMALKNNCDINDRKPQNHIRSHCSDKAHLPANPKIPIEQSSDANLSQQQLSDFDQENNSTSLERGDNSGVI